MIPVESVTQHVDAWASVGFVLIGFGLVGLMLFWKLIRWLVR